MNNVQSEPVLPAQRQQQPNRREFCFLGPRLQVSRVAAPIRVPKMSCSFIEWAGKLLVDHQRQSRPRYMRQRFAQLGLSDHGKAVDSGMNQKSLETRNPRSCQRFNFRLVVADYAGPG